MDFEEKLLNRQLKKSLSKNSSNTFYYLKSKLNLKKFFYSVLQTYHEMNKERKLSERSLELMSAELLEVNKQIKEESLKKLKEKDEIFERFVSMLTHDLRTPLIAQDRVYSLMGDNNNFSKENLSNLINILVKNNEHMLTMVNRLLENFKYESDFESKRLTLQKEKINLFDLINECLSMLSALAMERNIKLINQIQKEHFLELDSNHIKRVFINITTNAIENIPESSEIKFCSKDLENFVELTVQDNGTGIDCKNLHNIFEKYYSCPSRKKGRIGFGLGLYISKILIELHDGEINIESNKKGTKFFIKLPKSKNPI